ncbi:hypothetical protein N7475_002450 [Penicillium sp. IBT 31633x]|nr:hypothetical protein N7475_002450 [Penicillium sp. IBT 31633x]
MEAVGVAFAAFSLVNELEKCGKSLHRFSRDIRMAKDEVKMLKTEVSNCQFLASIFEEAIKPVKSRVLQLAKRHGLEKSLGEQSRLAREQILTITRKLRPLHRNTATGFEKLQAKIRWHFTKDDIASPLAVLQNVKASLTLLTVVVVLDRAVADAAQNRSSDSAALSQAIKRIEAL